MSFLKVPAPQRRAVVVLLALVPLVSCSLVLRAAGYPPQAARKSPPPGIQDRAIAVGASLPTTGDLRTTRGVLPIATEQRRIFVFYRGAW